jgi:DNA polymerase III epsilon subunit-like protein
MKIDEKRVLKYQTWHERALELSKAGFSGRNIAKVLKMGKSQVNDYLKAYRLGLVETAKVTDEPPKKRLNILYWDLESSLMGCLSFGIWNVNIPASRITKHSHLLSNSWAFNDEPVQGMRLTPEQVRDGDDLAIVMDTILAIEKADLIVTFNGKKFDVKMLNTRALFWGLPPIKYPKHIDLMQDAKRVFRFPSNSMQNISMYLGEEGKLSTSGSRLWERCFNWEDTEDCEIALKEILKYGKQDIVPTRNLHKRMMGWSKTTPNIGMMEKDLNGENTKENHELSCVHCGSNDVMMLGSKAYSSVNSFELYRCGVNTCRGLNKANKAGTKLVNYVS